MISFAYTNYNSDVPDLFARMTYVPVQFFSPRERGSCRGLVQKYSFHTTIALYHSSKTITKMKIKDEKMISANFR